MKEAKLTEIGTIRLNSFKPLCINEFGNLAIKKYNYAPFIDASCRREPDFENPFPSISALCRKGKFAPQLKEKDIVVYVTVQGRYPNKDVNTNHNRLVSIVQVIKTFESHQLAADWYLKQNLPLPNNCMIRGNLPKEFEQTAGGIYLKTKKSIKHFLSKSEQQQQRIGKQFVKNWDADYKERAENWQNFVVTKPVFLELINPPIILREDFMSIFKRFPNTQTPNKISKNELIEMGRLARLNLNIK